MTNRVSLCVRLNCCIVALVSCCPAIAGAPRPEHPVTKHVRLQGPTVVGSGISPYRNSCGLSRSGGMNMANVETDPRVTFDSTQGGRLQLSFMQDPVVGVRAAFSDDLGQTWEFRDPLGLSPCVGGQGNTFGDQDIVVSRNGVVGLISIMGNLVTDKSPNSDRYAFDSVVQFSRSVDRGVTWDHPVVISPGGVYQHTAMITVDSQDPALLYAAWATVQNPPGLLPRPPRFPEGFIYFARSTDAGVSWSAPVAMSPGMQLWDLRVLADRSLVAFVDGDKLVRSNDEGSTWEPPRTLPAAISNTALYSFANGTVMAGDLPLAVGSRGQLYFVASIAGLHDGAALQFRKSMDRGETWNPPVNISENSSGVFHATIAADPEGRLVAMWYELSKERPGDRKMMTRVRIAWSLDDGVSWTRRTVSRAFDMSRAPMLFGGHYLGNYQGLLAARARVFVGVFAVAPPVARRGNAALESFRLLFDKPTDVQ